MSRILNVVDLRRVHVHDCIERSRTCTCTDFGFRWVCGKKVNRIEDFHTVCTQCGRFSLVQIIINT